MCEQYAAPDMGRRALHAVPSSMARYVFHQAISIGNIE